MSVGQNLASVRERIARAGRDPSEITIVAVTKGFGRDVCRQALDAGLSILGENRVQEALTKMESVQRAEWHLIGHLQTNKVRQAARRFALIQSIDSLHLACAPVFLGQGESLFAGLDLLALGFSVTDRKSSEYATHVTLEKA